MGRSSSTSVLMLVVLSVAAVLAACGGSESGPPVAADAPPAVVIDVRTPQEYAAGHLEGAVNIDVQDPDFDVLIGDLDPNASYVVYCRSGTRSAAAVSRMVELGIEGAVDAGSLEAAASSTGLPVGP